jgi:endogenous inhibitor of DNA gyrase (YacG/DUF329 family)
MHKYLTIIEKKCNIINMFNDNKYTKWYDSIIDNAQKRDLNGYCERHHIIPRSLGGSDEPDNLVALTPKEHFVCHLLLTKMTEGRNQILMKYAATLMAGYDGKWITGKLYESLRQGWSQDRDHIANRHKSRRSRGYWFSEEVKRKIGDANRGRKLPRIDCEVCGKSVDPGNYKKNHGPNCGKKLYPISNEQKAKISKANKGRILPKNKCPHCGKLADGGNYTRWHGDNCKEYHGSKD